MNSNTIIVDLQGFKNSNNKFIVKELSFATKDYTQTFLIKAPYSFNTLSNEEKKQVRWLENNRGLNWHEGFIDYREFQRVIIPYLNGKNVLTKGLEKILWIQELCKDCEIIELGEKDCPNFFKLYEKYCEENNQVFNCIYHKKMCALKNVLCLKKWCQDNFVYNSLFN